MAFFFDFIVLVSAPLSKIKKKINRGELINWVLIFLLKWNWRRKRYVGYCETSNQEHRSRGRKFVNIHYSGVPRQASLISCAKFWMKSREKQPQQLPSKSQKMQTLLQEYGFHALWTKFLASQTPILSMPMSHQRKGVWNVETWPWQSTTC